MSKQSVLIFLAAFLVPICAFFGYNGYQKLTYKSFHERFFVEGYNFREMQSSDDDFAKVSPGDEIDVNKLVYSDDRKVTFEDNLLLLAIVDPECEFCIISKDIFEDLRNQIPTGISYTSAVFSRQETKESLNDYGQSIGFSDVIKWEELSSVPQSLSHMPTPAHILIDKNGTVLQVWFSSGREDDVRRRMSTQIVNEIKLINSIYPALQNK